MERYPRTSTDEILAKFINHLLTKKSLKLSTIKRKVKLLKSLINYGVELANPDSFVMFLNSSDWASGTKDLAVHCYQDYLNMVGLTDVQLPKIRIENKLPFIPLESEIDTVINSVGIKMSTYLRVLKDTGCRPIEAWKIKWLDVDTSNKCVTITAVKYSYSRKLKLKEQTLNMLLAIPKNNKYVFSTNGNKDRLETELKHFTRNYTKIRKHNKIRYSLVQSKFVS